MAEHDEELIRRTRSFAERLPVEQQGLDEIVRRGARRRLASIIGTAAATIVVAVAVVLPLRSLLPIGQKSQTAASDVTSPAPRECPVPFLRGGAMPVETLDGAMNGYLPTWLPEGFGLLRFTGTELAADGFDALAIWADAGCREVTLTFNSSFRATAPNISVDPSLPQVGPWTVATDAPGQCGNSVLGRARCLGYRMVSTDGTVVLQMMGLDRGEGDRIALSVARDHAELPPLVIEVTRPEASNGSYVPPRFRASYSGTEIPLEAIETPGPDLEYPRASSPVSLPTGTPILIDADAEAVAVFQLEHARGQYVVDQGACIVPGALSVLPSIEGSSGFFIYAEWSDGSGGMAFRTDLVLSDPSSGAMGSPAAGIDAHMLGLAVCEE